MQILFLNSKNIKCGVYQYGVRLLDILRRNNDITYHYIELDSFTSYVNALAEHTNANAIIYNYHNYTMSWLNHYNIQRVVKNIGIPHESDNSLFDIICEIDPSVVANKNIYSIPRPTFPDVDALLNGYIPSSEPVMKFVDYKYENYPIFGSFGFGCSHKGFDKIIQIVNQQYDFAIIKLLITIPACAGNDYVINTKNMVDRCIALNSKPGIHLLVTFDFFTNEDVLYFLRSNTMNIFLYDKCEHRSISSVIDYAVSVKKPIGISDSAMFRHIYSDDICLYKTSISDCIKNNTDWYNNNRFMSQFNSSLLIETFDKIYKENLNR